MVARKIHNSKSDRCRGRILNFDFWYHFENGSSQNSKFKIRPLPRSDLEFLILGINLRMIARKIQSSKFDRCHGRILNFEFKSKL